MLFTETEDCLGGEELSGGWFNVRRLSETVEVNRQAWSSEAKSARKKYNHHQQMESSKAARLNEVTTGVRMPNESR